MRFVLSFLGSLLLAGVLAFVVRGALVGAIAVPDAVAEDADEAAHAAAREARARLLDHEGRADLFLSGPLRRTDQELAATLRGKVPSAFAATKKSARWFWTQRLTEADRQLRFAAAELEDVARRGLLSAALCALAVACFVGAPRGRGGRSVALLGLLSLVFVLVPPAIDWEIARVVLAVALLVSAVVGGLVGARLAGSVAGA